MLNLIPFFELHVVNFVDDNVFFCISVKLVKLDYDWHLMRRLGELRRDE